MTERQPIHLLAILGTIKGPDYDRRWRRVVLALEKALARKRRKGPGNSMKRVRTELVLASHARQQVPGRENKGGKDERS